MLWRKPRETGGAYAVSPKFAQICIAQRLLSANRSGSTIDFCIADVVGPSVGLREEKRA
jgi:hypothetical protein